MTKLIAVRDLRKTFQVARRQRGALGALRSLVSRQHTLVRAVDGISFDVRPGELVGYLGPVVDFYRSGVARDCQNSFSNRSFAAENGWTTESVLTPGNRPGDTPDDCLPGEVPLVCELRIVRPAVALIMLGTNDVTYLPIDLYRANLSRIVETCIGMGVIPVLSTIPHRGGLEGQVAAFNDLIVQLAYGYDVPLWDYAAAMRVLPDGGLSGDWVHPNTPPGDLVAYFTPANLYYGYTVRNLTALQVLDAVWRNALR
jgi:hypothetical protein